MKGQNNKKNINDFINVGANHGDIYSFEKTITV